MYYIETFLHRIMLLSTDSTSGYFSGIVIPPWYEKINPVYYFIIYNP